MLEVHDNVRVEEIQELDGLLRHIYRRDSAANRLNEQRGFAKLNRVRSKQLDRWRATDS